MAPGQSTAPGFPVGKVLISLSAVWAGVGPFLFDWNETHIYNPSWPPHAKFHNGQTMSLGAGLAAAALLQLWRPFRNTAQARAALDGASVSAVLYWLTQASALAYPGAKAVDPPGTAFFPQGRYAGPPLVVVGLGYALERRRLRRAGGGSASRRSGTGRAGAVAEQLDQLH